MSIVLFFLSKGVSIYWAKHNKKSKKKIPLTYRDLFWLKYECCCWSPFSKFRYGSHLYWGHARPWYWDYADLHFRFRSRFWRTSMCCAFRTWARSPAMRSDFVYHCYGLDSVHRLCRYLWPRCRKWWIVFGYELGPKWKWSQRWQLKVIHKSHPWL